MAEENPQNQGPANIPHQIDLNSVAANTNNAAPQFNQGTPTPVQQPVPTPIPQTPTQPVQIQPTPTPQVAPQAAPTQQGVNPAGIAQNQSSNEQLDQNMHAALEEATSEEPKKKMNIKKIAIIATIVVVVLVGGYFAYITFFGNDSDEPSDAMQELDDVVNELEGNAPPTVQSPFDTPDALEENNESETTNSNNDNQDVSGNTEETNNEDSELNNPDEENEESDNNEDSVVESPPSLNLGGPGSQVDTDTNVESENSGKIAR